MEIQGKKLERGDIVRHKWSQRTYVVTGDYGDYATAVGTVEITQGKEWEIVGPREVREELWNDENVIAESHQTENDHEKH